MTEIKQVPDDIELLKSSIADVQNVNNDISGTDTIFAGAFLKEFIPENVKWLHIDLCKNYLKDPEKYFPIGSTGIGYRMGLKLIMDL